MSRKRKKMCTKNSTAPPNRTNFDVTSNPAAQSILSTQTSFHIISQVGNASSLFRHRHLDTQGHRELNCSFIKPSLSLRLSPAAPRTKTRYNDLQDNSRMSERPSLTRVKSFRASQHSPQNEHSARGVWLASSSQYARFAKSEMLS